MSEDHNRTIAKQLETTGLDLNYNDSWQLLVGKRFRFRITNCGDIWPNIIVGTITRLEYYERIRSLRIYSPISSDAYMSYHEEDSSWMLWQYRGYTHGIVGTLKIDE